VHAPHADLKMIDAGVEVERWSDGDLGNDLLDFKSQWVSEICRIRRVARLGDRRPYR